MVVFAIVAVALILFVGLALDAGVIYVRYGQLKRAVDAAAVSAANEFKPGSSQAGGDEIVAKMKAAALEMLALHNLDVSPEVLQLDVRICDKNGDGLVDAELQTDAKELYDRCPDTSQPYVSPRKLVWVKATQRQPFFFLSLLFPAPVDLTTTAISEAAPIDLVLVIDISESMGKDTVNGSGDNTYVVGNFEPDAPDGCNNTPGTPCRPLQNAKEAALTLVGRLHDGYDQVAVVTFDSTAGYIPIDNNQGAQVDLSDNMTNVKNAISGIRLNDDAPFVKLWPNWWIAPADWPPGLDYPYAFNPVNPEDRDGDGYDVDVIKPCGSPGHDPFNCCTLNSVNSADPMNQDLWKWRWDDGSQNPGMWNNYSWRGGYPCDEDNYLDAYDWNGDGKFTTGTNDENDDHWMSAQFLGIDAASYNGMVPLGSSLSPLSTCTGCGLRVASNILSNSGRPSGVWVIVILTDGLVNLSDTPFTSNTIPLNHTNGYCMGPPINPSLPTALNSEIWQETCRDLDISTRICNDPDPSTCPPGTVYEDPTNYQDNDYSSFDYAMDMADAAALRVRTNPDEPLGNDIGIYSIILGEKSSLDPRAVTLMRYIANVGDDGSRSASTDPCRFKLPGDYSNCGQYYYAEDASLLLPIFESIAERIYTRINQ